MAKPELRLSTDIDTMPLVRVSIEHGTEGLRQRLQSNLARIGLADNELIQASIVLGLDLHSGDRRTYEPYSGHLLRSTIRLIEQLGITDPEVIATEPLHDSLEDHSEELIRRFLDMPVPVDLRVKRELGREGLKVFADEYGAERVPGYVWSLSTPIRPKNVPKIPHYLGHTKKIVILGEPESAAGKNADFLDNVDTPIELEDPNKRAYLDLKQVGAYPLHIASLQREDSIVPPEFRDEAIALLRQKEEEARARLMARGVLDIASAANSLRTA
jgi:hypothetical protein